MRVALVGFRISFIHQWSTAPVVSREGTETRAALEGLRKPSGHNQSTGPVRSRSWGVWKICAFNYLWIFLKYTRVPGTEPAQIKRPHLYLSRAWQILNNWVGHSGSGIKFSFYPNDIPKCTLLFTPTWENYFNSLL